MGPACATFESYNVRLEDISLSLHSSKLPFHVDGFVHDTRNSMFESFDLRLVDAEMSCFTH